MPFKDKEKRKLYRREWYSKNKQSEKKYVSKRKFRIRNWFVNYRKSLICFKCGEDNPVTIDFHHKDEKKMNITKMVSEGYSIAKIIQEMSKCEVLCANCHRKVHINKF